MKLLSMFSAARSPSWSRWVYTSRKDVHLSPAYDMLTTSVYAGYQNSPPGISHGKENLGAG